MQAKKGYSSVQIHQGKALWSFAGRYYSLSETIKELVQNVFDNGASIIKVVLDMKNRNAEVYGNGFGATLEGFSKGLQSVCDSGVKETLNKSGLKFGRFGIGNFSPVDKCQKYEFIAFDPNVHQTRVWKFEGKKIKEKLVVQIPYEDCKSLPDKFNTCSKMTGIITDKVRTRISLSDFVNEIRTEFSVGFKANKAILEIIYTDCEGKVFEEIITAATYDGVKLQEVAFGENQSNKADFHLFIAQLSLGKRNGQVNVGISEDPFRLPLKKVFANAPRGILQADVAKALESGAFTGEIISSGCELTESRTTFSRNEALSCFCRYINTWWEKFGQSYYEEIRIEQELERFQELGIQTLEVAGRLLSSPDLKNFRDVISRFKVGSIGSGHAEIDPKLVLGKQDTTSVQVKSKTEQGDGKKSRSEGKEHKNHMPLTVSGPRGVKRTEVRDNSLGIQIYFSEMLGDSRMYAFDVNSGSLDINIRHPNWETLENSDDALVAYQLQCLFHALTSGLSDPSETERYYRTCAENHLNLMVAHLRLIH